MSMREEKHLSCKNKRNHCQNLKCLVSCPNLEQQVVLITLIFSFLNKAKEPISSMK
jgi:hypothetical protein